MNLLTVYPCNVILTFGRGQVTLDLPIPLEAGEAVCRALFLAVAATARPTPTNRLYTPALVARKDDDTLVKVSICAAPPEGATLAELDALPALKWFTETNGKLYFRP